MKFLKKILLLVLLPAAILSGVLLMKVYNKAQEIEIRSKGAQEYPDDVVNAKYKTIVPLEELKRLKIKIISPSKVVRTPGGNYFFDFGRASFGTLRIKVVPKEEDYTVDIRMGERSLGDSSVWFPKAGDHYPSRISFFSTKLKIGKGVTEIIVKVPERFRPDASQLPDDVVGVLPFRYAEILGLKGDLEVDAVSQLMVRYPVDINNSYFESSDSILNEVWDLGKHTLDATTYSQLFVDGNRERKPYEADAYINQIGYYAIGNDYILARNTLNYLLANPTWPTEWAFYTIFIAYEDFQRSGDLNYLKSIYSRLRSNLMDELIRSDGLMSTKGEFAEESYSVRGYKPVDIVDWPPNERDGYDSVRVEFFPFMHATTEYYLKKMRANIANFFGFYAAAAVYKDQENNANLKRYDLPKINTVVNLVKLEAVKKMAYLAKVSENHLDQKRFDNQKNILEKVIINKLINVDTKLFIDGEGSAKSSLHANMYALAFGIVPYDNLKSVEEYIISKGMACSVFGAQFLLDGLYRSRRANEALSLITSQTTRSWWGMIHNSGSTMTMESWSNEANLDSDWNHAWGTAPVNLISRWLVGVRPLEPGYKQIIIDPQPADMNYFKAKVPLAKGQVLVNYSADQNGERILDVHIPKEVMMAEIYIPTEPGKIYTVTIAGSKLNYLSKENRIKLGKFKSGHYKFYINHRH